jgi:uncharacterized repeat protein (TIGR02543 family)
MNSIKRINKTFITGMLAMALVFGMAGCDEVLNEPEKAKESGTEVLHIISGKPAERTCTVNLDTQGTIYGVLPQTVKYGDTLKKPVGLTRPGYTFGGWYTDTAFKSLYDFDTPVTADITIYAKWEPIHYKVIYNLNGAPGMPPELPPDNSGYLTYGQKVPVVPTPKWPGYTFDGWYLNADGTGKAWNFGTDTVTGDITLYAKWTSVDVPVISFADAITKMANNHGDPVNEYVYTLPGGGDQGDGYTTDLTLTIANNSPAKVTIYGGVGGWVVTGNGNRITIGSGVTLTLKNITFTKIPFSVSVGGKLVLDDGAVVQGNTGGGITVYGESTAAKGTLEMKAGSSVTGNGDSGVCIEGSGVFTMSGGVLSGNTAVRGGGVRMEGNGVFTMNGGEISGNSNADSGGGVGIWGAGAVFTMNGGSIHDNTSGCYGGGVVLVGGVFTMTGGEISGNSAVLYYGGGVFVWAGTFTGNPQIGGTTKPASGGWIHGNTPDDVR